MDALSLLVGLVAGLIAGGIIAWQMAAGREREARVRAEAQVAAMAGQQAMLASAEQRLTDTFRAAAAEALQGNTQHLLELAQQSLGQKETAIGGLVKPLQDALKQYEEHLTAVETTRRHDQGALSEQLRTLALANEQLQRQTGGLVTALRSPSTRGRWGELALRRVAELAGMTEHCDFSEQATLETDAGRLRPDLTVHLPGGRTLVVDSKVSVDAYLNAVGADTEIERDGYLQAHARQLRTHVQQLAGKEYWNQIESSPDFVVMFVAVEPSIAPAMTLDPALFQDALERRVIIATPSFLIALLLTVAHSWRQERLTQNALEVSKLGKELYDRIAIMVNHVNQVGRHLGRTVASYNEAVGSVQSRVLPSAQRLKELGVTGGNDLPAVNPVSVVPHSTPEADASPLPLEPAAVPAEPRRPRLSLNPDDVYGE